MEIRDRGNGIAAEIERTTTTPFMTTKQTGHGLGLYLAKSVVDRYNGTLEIRNRNQGGIVIRITLPLSRFENVP